MSWQSSASNVPAGSQFDSNAPWNMSGEDPTCDDCGFGLNEDGICEDCAECDYEDEEEED